MTTRKPDISLRADEFVAAGFARIARELIAHATDRIQRPTADRGEDVHVVRTIIKRLRGILRLLAPAISPTFLERENAHLRKAARRLAFSRDTAIARQTLTTLVKSRGNKRRRKAVAAAQAVLDKLVGPDVRIEEAMHEVVQDLAQTGRRIQRLRIAGTGWGVLGPGVQAVYRQGRNRMNVAFTKSDEASFHRWRIRVKHLYYALQLLEPVWPKRLGKMIARLHRLQAILGDDHDLATVKTLFRKASDGFADADAARQIVDCLDRKSRKLKRASRPLGKAIFRESPRRFAHELGERWSVWKKRR